jgi:hypothetical protein
MCILLLLLQVLGCDIFMPGIFSVLPWTTMAISADVLLLLMPFILGAGLRHSQVRDKFCAPLDDHGHVSESCARPW